MRDMKARQMGRLSAVLPNRRRKRAFDGPREGEDGENTTDEVHETIDEGILVDQGDGVRVVRKSRQDDEEEDRDCPDEPPPGWCDV